MNFLDVMLHALGFILPAFVVALLVTLAGRFFKKNRPLALSFPAQSAINFIACLAILLIGLVLTGRDGKMMTYAAMVIVGGTVQWFLSGGWRK